MAAPDRRRRLIRTMRTRAIIERWREALCSNPGDSKVRPLGGAIRDLVSPCDTLYLGGSLAKPNAAMFELIRAFRGTAPDFTVAAPAFANQHAPLVHSGILRKAITTIHGTIFPAPGPNAVYNRALAAGDIEFESWSLLSFALRLKAGALGLPFLPTKSLIGSDLGRELEEKGLLSQASDPFGGKDIALVPALHPDIAIIHGLAADAAGNTILCPPYYENTWGAFAAKRGVIVTVERIVEPDFIRRHAHLTRVPGSVVTAVCEVPLGGHPTGMNADPVPEIVGYVDDYQFLREIREAAKTPEAMDAWIGKWITGCEDHAAYLEKLGEKRIKQLKAETAADTWEHEVTTRPTAATARPASATETQICVAARAIHESVLENGYRVLLAGLGTSSLAAWLAAFTLREEGTPVDLMVEAGSYGYIPMPMDPFLFNYRNIQTATALGDLEQILGVMTGGFENRALGVLAAAEIDSNGDLNSSRLPDLLLTGSGGANDIASAADEVIVTVPHSPRRLVDRVHFVTSPGKNVRAIATDQALLRRGDDGRFRLSALVGGTEDDAESLAEVAKQGINWDIPLRGTPKILPPPTPEELELLRLFDPDANFLKS